VEKKKVIPTTGLFDIDIHFRQLGARNLHFFPIRAIHAGADKATNPELK
jgi:hypothetical protein